MHAEIQFSILLINKPGILAQILTSLGDEKVNILAMTMMDSFEHGVLRLVPASPEHSRSVLKKLSLEVHEAEVLCVTIPNKPGAMAEIAAKLSKAHININYCYVTAGARGGKTTGIFKVADIKKAIKVLSKKPLPKKNTKVVRKTKRG
ncbi:MAG: amino acid-binding protein [Phycisphaerae bacterium]|nr:amino acid-binding protein [Phycisphaerae bacterium]